MRGCFAGLASRRRQTRIEGEQEEVSMEISYRTVSSDQRDRRASTYARSRELICVRYPGPRALNHFRTSSSIRSVNCRFRGGGFSPRRTTALANISGVSSGLSDKSISSSRMASRRFQSVIDTLEEDFLLTACRFSCGNESNLPVSLGVRHGDDSVSQQPESDEAVFSTVSEVDPMLTDVRLPLALVPFRTR